MTNIFCYVTENGLQLDFPTARVQWVHSSGYSYYGFFEGADPNQAEEEEDEEEDDETEGGGGGGGMHKSDSWYTLLLEHKQMRDRT